MSKSYKDLLNDPYLLFEHRTKNIKQRLMILKGDINRVDHYISKAIIQAEIENLEDDLVERSLVLQERKKDLDSVIILK